MNSSAGRSRKVTSFDVARLAGVSRAAVSRAFTPNASVSPETREKVYQAAKELGYRVNYLARSLISRRSNLVGVIAAGMDNPYRAQQIQEITRALVSRNFQPILLPADQGESADHVMNQLLHYDVSGVVVTSDAPPTALCEEFAAHGVPIVLINKGDAIPLVDRVMSDNATAGRMAADLLAEAGARRLAVVSASQVSYTARHREEAFLARARELGCTAETLAAELNDYRNGYEVALAREDLDGLFCINDHLACGVVDALKARGLEPGSRVKVIGHDDIPQASWEGYLLTTFRQPCDVQAQQAIDYLLSRMDDPEMAERMALTPVTLVRRGTA